MLNCSSEGEVQPRIMVDTCLKRYIIDNYKEKDYSP